jgi:hypothetical protein
MQYAYANPNMQTLPTVVIMVADFSTEPKFTCTQIIDFLAFFVTVQYKSITFVVTDFFVQ